MSKDTARIAMSAQPDTQFGFSEVLNWKLKSKSLLWAFQEILSATYRHLSVCMNIFVWYTPKVAANFMSTWLRFDSCYNIMSLADVKKDSK